MKLKNIIFFIIVLFAGFQACQYSDSSVSFSSDSGTGGSMARFTIVEDHLYTVDQNNLKVFDLTVPESPEYKTDKPVGFDVETISPFGKELFLGTSSGMYIYDISTPTSPKEISFYEHIIACDPVVSDGEFAYVTLSGNNQRCWRSVNELQIVDLSDLQNPQLVRQYQMDGPRGLAIRNDTLWVCDDGLKVFDVSDKTNIIEFAHFSNLIAYDIILDKNRALVVGESGFVQYEIKADTIKKLSEITVGI